ncbi:hypothetical protein ACFTWF_20755 [Rhodococcus sp. NPDC056960]|uniref:hypothetical protein n=1 Tax=Rhodococcus sp. NPDC056960 TaxID=3345982 RepID=UPI003629ED2A
MTAGTGGKATKGNVGLSALIISAGLITGYLVSQAAALAALCAAAIALAFLWRKPTLGVGLWMVLVAVIPSWWTIRVGLEIGVATIVGIPLAVVILLSANRATAFAKADLWFCLFAITAIITTRFFETPLYATRDVIVIWLVAYLLGRLAGRSANAIVAVVGVGCGLWSILEFAFGLHVFESSSAVDYWASIQTRGSYERSEASFGHAIALGATLALSVPFVMQLRRFRGLCLVILALGTLATFSRGPMLAFGLSMLLNIFASHRIRFKTLPMAGLAVVGVAYWYTVDALQADETAGNQLNGSDAYRGLTFARTVETLNPIGLADGTVYNPITQKTSYSGITTVDNAPLLIALRFGWIPALILVILLIVLSWRVISRVATAPAAIALVAQIPVLLTAALLTQWQVFVLFAAGVAVTEMADPPEKPVTDGSIKQPQQPECEPRAQTAL